MASSPKTVGKWRSSIVKFEWMRVEDVQPDLRNARVHPTEQREALNELYDDVGILDCLKMNVQTGRLFDGHERFDDWVAAGAKKVPVLVCDIEPGKEAKVLAAFQAVGNMAGYRQRRPR